LADALALTVIVATHRAQITGVSSAEATFRFRQNGSPAPVYRHNGYCIGSVVLLWPGMIASFASTYIMWKSIQHDDQFGPRSSKHGGNKGEETSIDMATTAPKPAADSTRPEPYPSNWLFVWRLGVSIEIGGKSLLYCIDDTQQSVISSSAFSFPCSSHSLLLSLVYQQSWDIQVVSEKLVLSFSASTFVLS